MRRWAPWRIARKHLVEGFPEAVRVGVQHVLASPGFLFIQEPAVKPRPLNDYELASRLSYFLWSTMPDERLFDLADKGTLKQSAVLRAELSACWPTRARKVENFTGQWLSVREFGSVMPANNYTDYDPELEEASGRGLCVLRRGAGGGLAGDELPGLDRGHQRTAGHYGIEGVDGKAFRKVLRPSIIAAASSAWPA